MSNNEVRTVKVLRGNTWITISMKDLVEGDKFKLFENPDESDQVGTVWVAKSSPELTDGTWEIAADAYG